MEPLNKSLFPQTVELNPADFALIQDIKSELNAIGFDFSDFGSTTVVINGVPADLKTGNERDFLRAFGAIQA